MPMYEYRCRACGYLFELLRRIADSDRGVKCPQCKSKHVERMLSAFSAGSCYSRGGFG